jgi:hypothetical protein
MRAAAWLKTNQPTLNVAAPELPTNSPEQTAAPPPAQPPQHLFP